MSAPVSVYSAWASAHILSPPLDRKEYLSAEQTPPLGIYRIRVLPCIQRAGLASAMLDAALDDCVYGMKTAALVQMHGSKANTTAFSQPTQAGRRLAERWLQTGNQGHPTARVLVFDEPS